MAGKTKTQIPDGKGGFIDIEGDTMPGGTADGAKQAQAMSDAYFEEALELAERVLKFEQLTGTQLNMKPEQRAICIAYLCTTMRELFPITAGGPEKFDELAEATQDYFDRVVRPSKLFIERRAQLNARPQGT